MTFYYCIRLTYHSNTLAPTIRSNIHTLFTAKPCIIRNYQSAFQHPAFAVRHKPAAAVGQCQIVSSAVGFHYRRKSRIHSHCHLTFCHSDVHLISVSRQLCRLIQRNRHAPHQYPASAAVLEQVNRLSISHQHNIHTCIGKHGVHTWSALKPWYLYSVCLTVTFVLNHIVLISIRHRKYLQCIIIPRIPGICSADTKHKLLIPAGLYRRTALYMGGQHHIAFIGKRHLRRNLPAGFSVFDFQHRLRHLRSQRYVCFLQNCRHLGLDINVGSTGQGLI